jgi:hypothetical protein
VIGGKVTGFGRQSARLRRASYGAVALAVVITGGVLITQSVSPAARLNASTASSVPRAPATTSQRRLTFADYAAAPLISLSRLAPSDASARIALPWRQLASHNAHLDIVFASRPSCERLDGVSVEETETSVTINVLASNIPNAPNCDLVPRLNRTVITLAAPFAARSLRHARVDPTFWPTNPFDGP